MTIYSDYLFLRITNDATTVLVEIHNRFLDLEESTFLLDGERMQERSGGMLVREQKEDEDA